MTKAWELESGADWARACDVGCVQGYDENSGLQYVVWWRGKFWQVNGGLGPVTITHVKKLESPPEISVRRA